MKTEPKLKRSPSSPEDGLKRITAGALKSTIAAHGVISSNLIGSATKRIVRQLIAQYPQLLEVMTSGGKDILIPTRDDLIQLSLPLFGTGINWRQPPYKKINLHGN